MAILASVATMVFADAVVKLASVDITVWQIFVTRSVVAVPILIVMLRADELDLTSMAPRCAALG